MIQIFLSNGHGGLVVVSCFLLGRQAGLDGLDVFAEEGDGFVQEVGGLGQVWIFRFGGGKLGGLLGCGVYYAGFL